MTSLQSQWIDFHHGREETIESHCDISSAAADVACGQPIIANHGLTADLHHRDSVCVHMNIQVNLAIVILNF